MGDWGEWRLATKAILTVDRVMQSVLRAMELR